MGTCIDWKLLIYVLLQVIRHHIVKDTYINCSFTVNLHVYCSRGGVSICGIYPGLSSVGNNMITFYMISFDPDQATTVSKIQNQHWRKEIMKSWSVSRNPLLCFLSLASLWIFISLLKKQIFNGAFWDDRRTGCPCVRIVQQIAVAWADFLKGRGEKKGTLACVLAPKRAL